MSVIASLEDSSAGAVALVGGKAASLIRLVAGGYRVPPGFVVTTSTTSALAGREPGEWSPDLRAAILDAYRRLAPGGGAVAVRSSAADEDGAEASFAGQHATVLDVRGDDALLDAVAACIASLQSPAAVAYRARAASQAEPSMAVLVQRMVHAAISGVAFTADPLTGDSGRIIVEAVAGAGEGLVSGAVEADRLVLDRASRAVLEAHHPGDPMLNEALAQEIAELAIAIEADAGIAQDIEFAVDANGVWLLQARPITTGAPGGADGWVSEFDTPSSPGEYWTSANIQEVLPGALTPLAMSLFAVTERISWVQDYQGLKLLDADENPRFVGFFYSRAFLNVDATRLIADRTFFTSADAVEERYFGGLMPNETVREPALRRWKHRLLSTIPLLTQAVRINRAVEEMGTRTMALEARVQAIDVTALGDEALESLRRNLTHKTALMFRTHLRMSGAAGDAYQRIVRQVQPVLGEATEGQVPVLFSGMLDVESAQLALSLWNLSRIALQLGIADDVRRPGFDPYDPALPAAWHEALAAFVERHGHRALSEMDIAARSWRTEPKPFLSVVAAYVGLPESQSPERALERQQAARLALTERIAGQLGPIKGRAFRLQLGLAQRWVATRERTKSYGVRAARLGDYYLPEVQRRLVERGTIGAPDDLFFLTDREVTDALLGRDTAPAHDRVRRRRAELARNQHVDLPVRFRGRPRPIAPDLSALDADLLHGNPVSPGVVSGRARVILDPAVEGHIEPGEVLVAPVTDAGWTPLFALASALVVDLGSALSHGSTVAREYGLPAVVNVRGATRTIRTGDLLTVDGNSGTVAIRRDDAAAAEAP